MILTNLINKRTIPYIIIAALLLYILMIDTSEKKVITIAPSSGEIQIDTPKPEVRTDTVTITEKGKVIKQVVEVENPINKELLKKYNDAKDSIQKLKVFKESIRERLYVETLTDSIIRITVKSETVGTLKSQNISYTTKAREIEVNTGKRKPALYLGAFTTIPTEGQGEIDIGANLTLTNKKNTFTLGVTQKKTIHLGIAFKLF